MFAGVFEFLSIWCLWRFSKASNDTVLSLPLVITIEISFLLNKRLQAEKKNKDLIKKIFIHLIKNNNSNKVLNYIYSIADTMWKHSNDRSVDFNYYTKRLILSSVYLKILILIFYRENLTDKDIDSEIQKSLEHIKSISQFKIKFDFLKNIKEFFSLFLMQKSGRGF